MGGGDVNPTPEDLARDLAADLVVSYPTPAQLWEWGEAEDHDWIKLARVGWGAAIRRAIAAESEVLRLQAIIRGLTDRVAEQSELLSRRAERP